MAGRRHHTGAAPPSSGGPSRAHLQRVDEFRWEIPRSYKAGMRVSARVYASEPMLAKLIDDKALEQIVNVAHLPGIVGYALAMPDVHWGYGFPIGGVAAMDAATGVVSPGGIGFDINCGVRLIRSGLTEAEVRPRLDALLDALFAAVPSGVGSRGRIALSKTGIERVLRDGAQWAVREGYGRPHDIDVTEEAGRLASADPAQVSDRAKERGAVQLGTLGSGNHFLEVQVVDEIFDPAAATALGLALEQVVIFIHTGSRGCGYQICEDYLASFARSPFAQAIPLPDRQLVCAPIDAPEGRAYLAAMACGANFAWANRQCITHWAREAFAAVLGRSATALGLDMVYDVAHNIAKIEEHTVAGGRRRLCVHRKGATRAFPPGHPDLPAPYRAVGQPVLIPGDMARASFVAVGTERAMDESFGSTCHGAGRALSRSAALRRLRGVDMVAQLHARGVSVRVQNPRLLAEEAPEAYKDAREVVAVTDGAGISRTVARLRSIGVVKG